MPRTDQHPCTILLSMPCAAVNYPAMGISLLKAGLVNEGFPCDVKYFNLDYVEFVGYDKFDQAIDNASFSQFRGEWVFSHLVFPQLKKRDFDYLTHVVLTDDQNIHRLQQLLELKSQSKAFIEQCYNTVDWDQYDLVGFTTSFQQTMASLSLAMKVKTNHPHLSICFGGANVEGQMGHALVRNFPFVDFVIGGEADYTLKHVLASPQVSSSGSVATSIDKHVKVYYAGTPSEDLDELPLPDFSDYFEQFHQQQGLSAVTQPIALLETSRGCWWGEKSHCLFCGLNGTTMNFRSKSPARVASECAFIADTYSSEIMVVDNILDMNYFDKLLPRLAALDNDLKLHVEVKSNLKPWHLKALADSGVFKIQPGIETLSTPILNLMGKGCTAIQNIQLLKLAREVSIEVDWNFLFGFPGETDIHYQKMVPLIPMIVHLAAPGSFYKVRADRFSPYFNSSETHAIKIEPNRAYSYIYDLPKESIQDIAYHFEIQSDQEVETASCLEEVQRWIDLNGTVSCTMSRQGNRLAIEDNRFGQAALYELEGVSANLYTLCHSAKTLFHLSNAVGKPHTDVKPMLDQMIDMKILLKEGGYYLSLATELN